MTCDGPRGARLEDLQPGARVDGIDPRNTVEVVAVDWHGTEAITLIWRANGRPETGIFTRDDEPRLTLASPVKAFPFDADPARFRLVAEARRITMAYRFDPFQAVHSSAIEPLPHQITAVYREMLPRQPLRFLLADDPGAGKTIMAGLLIKELIVRGDVERCLIVAPGVLVEQWQDELRDKLGLVFEIATRDMIEASHDGNPFVSHSRLIARLDHLARNAELQEKLAASDWDLVIADEAHKMSAHFDADEVRETKRYKLGRLLGAHTRHLLLMTATPHSGKEADFQLFLALLDADRFEGRFRDGVHAADTSDLMRRLVKENLLTFQGTRLFPPRFAHTASYALSEPESRLYDAVTAYVKDEMNRVERLDESNGKRRVVVGFALTTLQRRLASSPEAIYKSLVRRRQRLERRIHDVREGERVGSFETAMREAEALLRDDLDLDDLPEQELREIEDDVVDQASAARTIAELETEVEMLTRLEAIAAVVRREGRDSKWQQFAALIRDRDLLTARDGSHRKLIVFTEHRDTLEYLVGRIGDLLGDPAAIVAIHGGLGRERRRAVETAFTQDPDVLVLVATDAAGEGINLQRAHLLVNYDLPWNPNRIEQRFGRIHRIGQTEDCHMWNLLAEGTREGDVFRRLFEKLEVQREALGGQVFDVLGNVFTEHPLHDLIVQAIRFDDDPERTTDWERVIDDAVGAEMERLLAENALVPDVLGDAEVAALREEMARSSARRLQPHFIRSFFSEAFQLLGGRIDERETGRFQVARVPGDVRHRDRQVGTGAHVQRQYERVTFDRALVAVPGHPVADLICPGHGLLDATVDLVLERFGHVLRRGAILIDEDDACEDIRVLVVLEHEVADSTTDRKTGRRRVISRRFEFVELGEHGVVSAGGLAPYLDYRAPTQDELAVIEGVRDLDWLAGDIEEMAQRHAIMDVTQTHLAEVRGRTHARVDRTAAAVRDRLHTEIRYWSHRAAELAEQERAGLQPAMNAERARQRADDLAGRLKQRLELLDAERDIRSSPPEVVGAALIVPRGYVERSWGHRTGEADAYAADRERVERLAVDAVLATERRLGRIPVEQARNNPGFDILSSDDAGAFTFVEVKGRAAGARTVTVTKTEILTALNRAGQYILALVAVAEDGSTDVRYLSDPFSEADEGTLFNAASVNYHWERLWGMAEAPV